MNNLTSFRKVRTNSSTYKEALIRYADIVSRAYCLDFALSQNPDRVLIAEWMAYRSDSVTVKSTDLALFFLGFLSFTERQSRISFLTYHPVGRDHSKNCLFRSIGGRLLEAASTFIGIAGISLTITGILMALFGGNVITLFWKIFVITSGVSAVLVSRFILKYSLYFRIPRAAHRDSSSPFYLVSVKTSEIEELVGS